MNAESVLHVDGDIDFWTAPDWRLLIEDRLSEQPASLVLDLGRVKFMDSSGLSMLITARATCTAQSTTLLIRNSSAPVLRLFELTGIDHLFKLM